MTPPSEVDRRAWNRGVAMADELAALTISDDLEA
jgi:hypothetical protein